MKDGVIVFVCVILVVLFGMYWHRVPTDYHRARKTIWTYWENPDTLPRTVKMCMESWKKHNSDYEVILLTKKNYMGYVTLPEGVRLHPNFHDYSERFSELIRLYVLVEYGGVWLDARTLVSGRLNLFPRYAEWSGFSGGTVVIPSTELEKKSIDIPLLSSWCMACDKNSSFLRVWKEEFLEIGKFVNVEGYVESRKRMGVRMDGIVDPNEKAILVSAQKVLQIDRYPLDTLVIQREKEGPTRYLVDVRGDSEKGLELACQDRRYRVPIMRMREEEQKILDREFEYGLSPDRCGWLD